MYTYEHIWCIYTTVSDGFRCVAVIASLSLDYIYIWNTYIYMNKCICTHVCMHIFNRQRQFPLCDCPSVPRFRLHICTYTPTYMYILALRCVFRTLQHTATHCNTLQHTAKHCNTLQDTATHCNTLQHAATHCNTLQHTATHCKTLQHAAPQCNTQ